MEENCLVFRKYHLQFSARACLGTQEKLPEPNRVGRRLKPRPRVFPLGPHR